jgi:hypothetical protein
MDMNQKEIHQAVQKLALFNQLMFNKEVLTQEEYEFCKAWDFIILGTTLI